MEILRNCPESFEDCVLDGWVPIKRLLWYQQERLVDLHMERVYEDHEMLVDQLMLWTRDSRNTLLFVERPQKYGLFIRPEDFLLAESSSERDRNLDDDARSNLIDEFFGNGSSGSAGSAGCGVPDIEGPLYLKAEGKKAWKRSFPFRLL